MAVVALTAIFDSQHNYYNDPWTSCVQIARQTSLLGIFSLGSAIVIIAGGIDLSSGSVICFSGTICATFLLILAPGAASKPRCVDRPVDRRRRRRRDLVVGLLIGSLHAWLITVIGLPPFVATLATLVGLRSFARAICENVTTAVIGGRSTQIQIFDARFPLPGDVRLDSGGLVPVSRRRFLGAVEQNGARPAPVRTRRERRGRPLERSARRPH